MNRPKLLALAEGAYADSLVADPALLPKALSKVYVSALKKGARGLRIEVEKSETTMPKGWDYGNWTILQIAPPGEGRLRVEIVLRVAKEESSGIVRAGGDVISTARRPKAEQAVGDLLSDLLAWLGKE